MGVLSLIFEAIDRRQAEKAAALRRAAEKAEQRKLADEARRAAHRLERRADGAAFARRCLQLGPLHLQRSGLAIGRRLHDEGPFFRDGYFDTMARAFCEIDTVSRPAA